MDLGGLISGNNPIDLFDCTQLSFFMHNPCVLFRAEVWNGEPQSDGGRGRCRQSL